MQLGNLAVNFEETEKPTDYNSERNFRTIGEVSSELGVPPYVLRFWESKFHIIKPHKRKGGHRYYSIQDVEKIRQIKKLLYDEGFTIKGAKKYLREKPLVFSEKPQANLFEEQQKELKENSFKQTSQVVVSLKPNTAPIENKPRIDPEVINSFVKQLESVKDLLNSHLI